MTVHGCTVPPDGASKPRPPPMAGVSHFPARSDRQKRIALAWITFGRRRTVSIRAGVNGWSTSTSAIASWPGAVRPRWNVAILTSLVAQRLTERADKAGLVVIAHEQHVPAEFGFERDALDIDEARLVAGEDGAGDRRAAAAPS